MADICSIIPCGQPVSQVGVMTCNNPLHQSWYQKYRLQFTRLSYPGVQRVIRRQTDDNERQLNPPRPVTFQVQLPDLGDTAGVNVIHTFRARRIYCVQTVQWACGIPIGWGKCYNSESTPQVLSILNHMWCNHPDSRPSFILYDNACDLLRHIVTQNARDSWLTSTKFIVNAWHYIGHQARDVLWCNPSPLNGLQHDLVLTVEDSSGVKHSA